MAERFRALPDALQNTVRVAEMCSGLTLELGEAVLPEFPVPPGYDTDSYFRHVSREGLEHRLADFRRRGKPVEEGAYRQRLEVELDVISGMRYPGYFLIVWDFIREAKARGIPVGPGRGSGAGSLVAYALGITEIEPIRYGLLFERFLNPERVSMPDFDIDFCMARRDEVIAYVAAKYGKSCVGQIGTFQNLKARSVIKDVARAMGIQAPEAQRIASLVPPKGQGKMCTIDEALEVEPKLKELVETNTEVAELIGLSRKLEGLTRHAGMHAAGIVISERPLSERVPCFKSDESIVTQYDKDDIEAVGLVKFDFLGLKTLTLIDVAQKLVNARPDRQGQRGSWEGGLEPPGMRVGTGRRHLRAVFRPAVRSGARRGARRAPLGRVRRRHRCVSRRRANESRERGRARRAHAGVADDRRVRGGRHRRPGGPRAAGRRQRDGRGAPPSRAARRGGGRVHPGRREQRPVDADGAGQSGGAVVHAGAHRRSDACVRPVHRRLQRRERSHGRA
jgi:hypothetical protein